MQKAADTMQNIGLFPGSFDPIHNGHVSVAERAARLLDKLYVAVAVNPAKACVLSLAERRTCLEASLKHLDNVEVVTLEDGLTVDHARVLGVTILIRGIRSGADFLEEFDIFNSNLFLQTTVDIRPGDHDFIDTQTFFALPDQVHISAALIRHLMRLPAIHHRDERLRQLVPEPVFSVIRSHISQD